MTPGQTPRSYDTPKSRQDAHAGLIEVDDPAIPLDRVACRLCPLVAHQMQAAAVTRPGSGIYSSQFPFPS